MSRDSMASMDTERLRAAAVADDAFGADVYRLLGVGGRNTVFSPASIAAALQMALCGARGNTATQIAAALHLTGPDAAGDGLRLLSETLRSASRADGGQDDGGQDDGGQDDGGQDDGGGDDGGADDGGGDDGGADDGGADVTLRVPNTMWVQAGLPLSPGFTGQLRDVAAVTVRAADFRGTPQEARAQINQLIAEQTAGKITNLIGPDAISPVTRLVLANAIYLKAAWAFPFTAHATADAPFYPGDEGGDGGETAGARDAGAAAITVQMMRRTANLAYLRGDGYQAVLLPYKASPLAMAVVLPDGPLPALAPRLAGGVGGLLGEAEHRSVALALPKFRQRASFGLIPVLRQLGIQDAFTDAADFSGITAEERLLINAVVHQAYIAVDEQGTEAAAATAIGMRPMALRRGPEPIPMTVDRPFLFALIDTGTGLPLFLGQVTRPATS